MASTSLTASYTGYSRPASNTAWTATTGSSEWYVGNSSGTVYCGRVEFVTPADVDSGTALSITVVCSQTSNPGYTRAYLCSTSLASTQCQSITTLQAQTGYIGILKNTLNSGNQSAGTSITYTYDGALSLAPNTTYYIYFLRNGTSYNGFCAFRPNPTLSLTYTVRQCTLTITGDSGVDSVTGSGSYPYGATATTAATAKTGYHLTHYSGTNASGTGTSTWSGCSGLTSHTDQWTMNANRTIQVHSALDTYTVSYDANGGSGAPSAQTKTYGVNLTLSTTKPTRSSASSNFTITGNGNGGSDRSITATKTISYTFAGWATSSGGSVAYAAGASYTANAAVTLYAVWTATTSYSNNTIAALGSTTRADAGAGSCRVTLDANGGACGIEWLEAPRTTAYGFLGWGASAGAANSLPANTAYTAAATVYARWSSATMTASVTLPAPTRAGYAFLGWAADPTAESGATGSYTPSGDVTLYAIWEPSGQIHLYDGSSWRNGLVWVFDGTVWRQGLPWVYDGAAWKTGG